MVRAYILGYGKMGKKIEALAESTGVRIVGHSNGDIDLADDVNFQNCQVVIEFTRPESAYSNIKKVLSHGKPIVSGTTGWLGRWDELEQERASVGGRFFYASNFSFGANVLFFLNRRLAALMSEHEEYKASMLEIHHLQKLDKPSGTAVTLAEAIIAKNSSIDSWSLEEDNKEGVLSIECFREPDVKGTHEIRYESEIDNIIIRHEAKSRDGFALGALHAAKWLVDRSPGSYGMSDLLGIKG